MNIKNMTTDELRRMKTDEGLVLQGCGGDLKEWLDGINDALRQLGILLDNTAFTENNVVSFKNEDLTCLLFRFNDSVKLDMGKLAMWRLQTHENFGGTWLSDYIPNRLGGYLSEEQKTQKPDCPLIGADGNIFNLMGIAKQTLRRCGQSDILGQILGAVLAFIYLFRMKAVKLQRSSFSFSKKLLMKIIPLGFTSFLTQVSMVLSMAAVLNMIKKYGALDPVFGQEAYAQIPTAVIGIVMKFFQIVISVAIGLAAGCIPIVGYNVGAGNKARVREMLTKLISAEAVIGVIAFIIFESFPKQLIGIFGAANESVYYTDFAVRCIRIFLSMIVLSCVNKGMTIFLQSLGKAKESTVLSLLREIICGVGLPLLMPVFFGLNGILYFMAAADIITFIASVIIIIREYKQLKS